MIHNIIKWYKKIPNKLWPTIAIISELFALLGAFLSIPILLPSLWIISFVSILATFGMLVATTYYVIIHEIRLLNAAQKNEVQNLINNKICSSEEKINSKIEMDIDQLKNDDYGNYYRWVESDSAIKFGKKTHDLEWGDTLVGYKDSSDHEIKYWILRRPTPNDLSPCITNEGLEIPYFLYIDFKNLFNIRYELVIIYKSSSEGCKYIRPEHNQEILFDKNSVKPFLGDKVQANSGKFLVLKQSTTNNPGDGFYWH